MFQSIILLAAVLMAIPGLYSQPALQTRAVSVGEGAQSLESRSFIHKGKGCRNQKNYLGKRNVNHHKHREEEGCVDGEYGGGGGGKYYEGGYYHREHGHFDRDPGHYEHDPGHYEHDSRHYERDPGFQVKDREVHPRGDGQVRKSHYEENGEAAVHFEGAARQNYHYEEDKAGPGYNRGKDPSRGGPGGEHVARHDGSGYKA